MWSQLLIGVGGMVVLALVFAVAQQAASRARALQGDCRMDSLRCLGCLATGRCKAAEQGAPKLPADATSPRGRDH